MDIVAFTHDAKEMTFDPVLFEIGHGPTKWSNTFQVNIVEACRLDFFNFELRDY